MVREPHRRAPDVGRGDPARAQSRRRPRHDRPLDGRPRQVERHHAGLHDQGRARRHLLRQVGPEGVLRPFDRRRGDRHAALPRLRLPRAGDLDRLRAPRADPRRPGGDDQAALLQAAPDDRGGPRQARRVARPAARRAHPRGGEPRGPGHSGRPREVLRHAAGRPERRDPAREPPRPARLRRHQRVAEPRRLAQREHARRVDDRRADAATSSTTSRTSPRSSARAPTGAGRTRRRTRAAATSTSSTSRRC